MAGRNAREEVERITSDAERVNKTLEQLQQLADLPVLPRRMESYDISHTAGQDMVASMVVFADGKPLKRDYRRFQIKTLDHADDLRALQEVLQRRMQRYLDGDEHFSPLPDLLLMDGGHLQAQATQQQLESMGIHIPILGMVKDDPPPHPCAGDAGGPGAGHPAESAAVCAGGPVQEEVHRLRHRLSPRKAQSARHDLPSGRHPRHRGRAEKGAAEALQERQGHLGGGACAAGALLPKAAAVRYTTISMRKTPERRGPAKMAGPLLSSGYRQKFPQPP